MSISLSPELDAALWGFLVCAVAVTFCYIIRTIAGR